MSKQNIPHLVHFAQMALHVSERKASQNPKTKTTKRTESRSMVSTGHSVLLNANGQFYGVVDLSKAEQTRDESFNQLRIETP